jgi:predicted ester cyclase
VRWHVAVTHVGDHLGIPATGKKASFPGAGFDVIKDSKIVAGWNYMDMGQLYKQLGVARP